MYGWMTPVELCRFLAPFYPTWDTKLARDSLDRFEIPSHTRIGRLSKGQAVKLGLVVALAHRPAIVILDDPAMGLDPIARKEFNRDLVEHLQTSGCTVLYSSHLLDEVEAVADAVAILDRGKIVRTATTDHLRDEVKQVVLAVDSLAEAPRPEGLLDVRRHDDRVAIITDQAGRYIQQLSAGGIDHNVVDLSLDEIFEAYVIGRAARLAGSFPECAGAGINHGFLGPRPVMNSLLWKQWRETRRHSGDLHGLDDHRGLLCDRHMSSATTIVPSWDTSVAGPSSTPYLPLLFWPCAHRTASGRTGQSHSLPLCQFPCVAWQPFGSRAPSQRWASRS